jgi:uncharacterized Tic20 family protein
VDITDLVKDKIETEDGTLEIKPKPVTVTADDKSKIFGESDPNFDGRITSGSLVAADDLGLITYRRPGVGTDEAVNTYSGAIIAEYANNANYDVDVIEGDFEITASDALNSLTVGDYTGIYDGAAHSVTINGLTVSAFVEYSIDGVLWSDTPPMRASVVGTPLTVYVRASAFGYDTAEGSGTITINPRPIVITVDDASKTLGDNDPTFTGRITSGELVASTDLGTIGFIRTNTAEAVGTYTEVLDADYTDNTNYLVTVEKGDFEIVPPEIIVIDLPDPYDLNVETNSLLTIIYGDSAPTDEQVHAALLEDILSNIPEQYRDQLGLDIVVDSSAIGEFVNIDGYDYGLTFDYDTDRFNIVSPEYVKAVLVVNPRELTITLDDASKVFDGAALVADSWSYSGLRDGDVLSEVTVSGSQTAVGSSASGVIGFLVLRDGVDVTGNYTLVSVPGTLTVTAVPAVPVVPAAPVVPVPPADDPALIDVPITPIPDPVPPATPPDNDDDQTTTPIPDPTSPLTPPSVDAGSAWALVNLILTIVGALLAFVVLVAFFIGRKEEKEKEDDARMRDREYTESTRRRKRIALRIVSLVAAIAAAILFLLTEDMTQPMQLVDMWTIVHAIIFIVQIVLTIFATRKKSDDDTKPLATSQAPAA